MMTRMAWTATCVAALSLSWGCGSEAEEAFEAAALELRADGAFTVGSSVQLRAVGIAKDGKEKELSDITFLSSNEQVARVDETGLVSVLAGGPVSFRAENGRLEATLEARTRCEYPRFSPKLEFNRVVPPLSWPAKWPDGTDFEFNLEDVHCDLDWAETKTVTFVLSAGWCSPCTLYAQRLVNEYARLKSRGMEVIIIEVQDTEGRLADVDFAYRHLKRITDDRIPGISAGDADTRPEAGFLEVSEILRGFPSVFVVRTRDMRIIADQNRSDFYLPLDRIAANPEANWSDPFAPFENNCGPGDEEASEPNDTPATAAPITPGTHRGGICAEGPDLYRIDIQGPWTVQLDFTHAVGDLDLFLWDEDRHQPAVIGGQVVGSTTQTDGERLSHSGPGVIAVVPYNGASAPYVLTLTAE